MNYLNMSDCQGKATGGGGGNGATDVASMTQETLTNSGTWTVPTNVSRIQVEMVGAGGAGSYPVNSDVAGAGGGAGMYIRGLMNVTAGQVITYTIGVGAPSVTSAITGNQGGFTRLTYNAINVTAWGGYSPEASNSANCRFPGIGGSGGTGASNLFLSGYFEVNGADGYTNSSTAPSTGGGGGNGGSSYFGGGGAGGALWVVSSTPTWTSATNGDAYGAGGGGGQWNAASKASGSGANGVIILSYFSQQQIPSSNAITPVAPLSFSGSNLVLDRIIPYSLLITFATTAGNPTITRNTTGDASLTVVRNSTGTYTVTSTTIPANAIVNATYCGAMTGSTFGAFIVIKQSASGSFQFITQDYLLNLYDATSPAQPGVAFRWN
jgi:hypothetical protein